MTLKSKLILTYVIVLIISVIMCLLAAVVVFYVLAAQNAQSMREIFELFVNRRVGQIVISGSLRDFLLLYFSGAGSVLCVILVISNFLIAHSFSQNVIHPLNTIKRGADEIKHGNFDYEIPCTANDELGQVCMAFEEMRIQLKKSVIMRERAEENRKSLFANMSHDMKTPLTNIKGYLEGIMDGVADTPEKRDRYLNTIKHNADYMSGLIDDILLYSKLDLKQMPFYPEPTNLYDFLQSLVTGMNIPGLELKSEQAQIIANIDRQKFARVINNIVSNSVRHKSNDRPLEISIALKREYDGSLIVISDNGGGISPDKLPYVFERFYRADPSRRTDGSGLGLAIVKQIIDGHKGRLWIKSKINEGTQIYVKL